MNVAAIILAAGSSSRLGRPKALLEYRGRSLVLHAMETVRAAGLDDVMVVLGSDESLVRKHLETSRVKLVENARWHEGIGKSVSAGISALKGDVEGALIMLCDQPHIQSSHLASLLNRFAADPSVAVASGYAGTAGVPAIFPRRLFGKLQALTGTTGAKGILQQEEAVVLPCPDAEADIDTGADLQLLG
jgi:molybdenum cofactor cytidylyltransferase